MLDGRFDPLFADLFATSHEGNDAEDGSPLIAALALAAFFAGMAVLCLVVG